MNAMQLSKRDDTTSFKTPIRCWGFIILLLLLHHSSHSSIPEQTGGTRAAGLSYSTISLSDPWALFHNQAGLGWQRDYWIGAHHENRFFVKELGYSALGVCIPVKPGTLGFGLNHFGFNQFSRSRVGLSYGTTLGDRLAAGVGINYHDVHIAEYGSRNAFTVEGGILYQPIDKLMVGAHLFNPAHQKFTSEDDLPTMLGIGLAFKPANYLLISTQVDDNSATKPTCRLGLEYLPINGICFRGGFATNPLVMSFGLGWRVKGVQLDMAFSYHEVMGYSPHISVAYTIGTKTTSSNTSP